MMKDIVESIFELDGYTCVVKFMPTCHRCGYVGVPKSHPFYGEMYENIPVECHGCLTYSDSSLISVESEGIWWIGFDCAHWGDKPDFDKGLEYFSDSPQHIRLIESMRDSFVFFDDEFPKDLEYCEGECRRIVGQLKGFESNGQN